MAEYTQISAQFKKILIHASAVQVNGKALIFLGPPETGKTTVCRLLSPHFELLADDAIYIIPSTRGWTIVDATADARNNRALSKAEWGALAYKGLPLLVIFRVYQASESYIEQVSPLDIAVYLVDAFFEIRPHKYYDLETIKNAFTELAKIGRFTSGYHLYFDKSPQVVEVVKSITFREKTGSVWEERHGQ